MTAGRSTYRTPPCDVRLSFLGIRIACMSRPLCMLLGYCEQRCVFRDAAMQHLSKDAGMGSTACCQLTSLSLMRVHLRHELYKACCWQHTTASFPTRANLSRITTLHALACSRSTTSSSSSGFWPSGHARTHICLFLHHPQQYVNAQDHDAIHRIYCIYHQGGIALHIKLEPS